MEAIPVSSRIEAVTVYRRGARVTRVAEVAAEGGRLPDAVRLGGLPLTLHDGSIRVRVDGEGALPVAADVRVALEIPEVDATLPAADALEVEAARAEVDRCGREIATLERQLARFDRVQIAARPMPAEGEPPGPSPTAARLALVDFRTRREQTLRDRLHQRRRDLDQALRRRELAEDRDRRASTARQAREHELKKSVEITLRGGGVSPGSLRIELEYQVAGARWSPAYTVRFDHPMGSAELTMRALVGQRTGEDWRGVALTLSTADAQRFAELPELQSKRIGRRQPAPARPGWRSPPTGAEELYADYDRSFAARRSPEPPAPPRESYAEREEEATVIPSFADEFDDPFEAQEAFPPAPPSAAPMAGAYCPEPLDRAPMRAMSAIGGLLSKVAPHAKDEKKRKAPGRAAAQSTVWLGGDHAMADERAAGGGGSDQPEPELTASDEMLSYGELRMAAPRAAGRGRLTLASRQEIYLALLVRQEVEIGFDVMTAIAAAEGRASSLETAALPPRCHPVWSEEYDYAYRAEVPIDVVSDGELQSIPLSRHDATARPLYIVVPRHSTDVFRTVELDNPLDAPLLRGPIDVYWRGDFLLTSDVDFTVPRAAVRLGLGVEQAIKVSRNTRYREETAGLIGGSLELDHQIVIEAVSHLDRAVALEVRERVPVVRDDEEEIKFEIKKVSPPWQRFLPFPDRADAPELRGGHRWQLRLEPGAKQELRVDYQIKISGKHELVGGNRREV